MIKSRIGKTFATVLTSDWLRDTRRRLAEARRRLRGAPLEVHYFHQIDDPYSQLAACMLPALLETYDVELIPHLVGKPPDEAAPEREKLESFARADAAAIAPTYGLPATPFDGPPAAALAALATRILAAASAEEFARHAAAVGEAMWTGDESRLAAIAEEVRPSSEADAAAAVARGSALRAKLGHYLGAMFYCAPEWYWGVDRLHFLEERLRQPGNVVKTGAAQVAQRRELPLPDPPQGGTTRLQLEFYPSLRSPYSAISMGRVFDLGRRYPIDIILRPVLPMVMRGLPVPLSKRLYIVLDTKREAEHAGVPFGRICDPVGEPIERGFSLYHYAVAQGRAAEYLQSFAEGVFADGIDAGTDAGLRRIVERAGLSWGEAQAHRREHGNDESWREELEANRQSLFEHGLWGVPSFRLIGIDGDQDFCTWGQDRIWLVEQEIRRRLQPRPSKGEQL